MKKWISIAAMSIFIITLFCIDLALAGPVSDRQIRQRHRIHQGIKSGELTRGETAVLEHEQKAIQGLKKRSWQDGRLTLKERSRLESAQDRSSDHIYFLKHNNKKN